MKRNYSFLRYREMDKKEYLKMKVEEAQKKLLLNIYKVFGKSRKPTVINGFLEEPWQKRLLETDLCDVSEEDFWSTIDHVFPRHYGDINVFRYLLSGCLPFFILFEPDMFSNLDKEMQQYTSRVPKVFKNEKIYGADYHNVIQRCVEWQRQLNPNEQQTIGEVFEFRFIIDCLTFTKIQPEFFICLLIWFRNLDKINEILEFYPVDIAAFKERGRNLLKGYEHITDMSAFAAVIGAYFVDDYFSKGYECLSVEGQHWFSDGLNMFDSYHIHKFATKEEVVRLDRQLEAFFAG